MSTPPGEFVKRFREKYGAQPELSADDLNAALDMQAEAGPQAGENCSHPVTSLSAEKPPTMTDAQAQEGIAASTAQAIGRASAAEELRRVQRDLGKGGR